MRSSLSAPLDPSSTKARPASIALLGNPNTGKSTVFNALCGTRQRVGNYPGVTVEKKMGRLELGSETVSLIDLPGVYSLEPRSPDEMITIQVLSGEQSGVPRPDLVLFVMDATNIKRNLYLFSQAVELGIPLLVILTMTDLLEEQKISLDINRLQELLGVPILQMPAGSGQSIVPVHTSIAKLLASPVSPNPCLTMENATATIAKEASIRYGWAQQIVADVEQRGEIGPTLTDRLDRFFLHRFYGLVIFAAIMFLVFQSIYTWAVPFMDLIDLLFGSLSAGVGRLFVNMPVLQSLISDGVVAGVGSVVIFLPQIMILFLFVAVLEDSGYLARTAFLMDKLVSWTGLNGRAFIPMLSGFACAIPAIMATRVMPDPKARMATILVTPLTSCSARLPVYLLLISTFIEPRFGAAWAAFCLFAMHALGLILALPIAWFLNRKILKAKPLPFVLEMPAYKMPRIGNVLHRVAQAGNSFLRQAGTIIFACSILIWALSYFPRPDKVGEDIEAEYAAKIAAVDRALLSSDDVAKQIEALEEEQSAAVAGAYLEQSYLGRAGKAVQPVFAPLGFDWKISVGIIGAFPAREVIISTLGIVYSLGDVDETSSGLKDRLEAETDENGRPIFTPLVAITLMVFFALCSQCMSTLATVRRELNSWKWTGFLFLYMTLLAYLGGLIVYQGGRLLGWA